MDTVILVWNQVDLQVCFKDECVVPKEIDVKEKFHMISLLSKYSNLNIMLLHDMTGKGC